MGQIALNIPLVGQPNATEDAKVASDLTTIQTVINGNLDDTNLVSPNNAVRRVLFTAVDTFGGSRGTQAAGTYVLGTLSPLWAADSGLSSQPQDFQVATKVAYGRVRWSIATDNASWGGVTFTVGLYPVTATTGAGITYTLGTVLAGSTAAAAPTANQMLARESGQFALPTAAGFYLLAVATSATIASSATAQITAQLLAYNA